MNKSFKYSAIAVGIGAVSAAVYGLFFFRPRSVAIASLSKDVAIQVFGLGTVEARVLSKVGFEVGGSLIEVRADHGDRVPSGAALARLHDDEQKARVAKAKAGLVNAEAALKAANSRLEKARVELVQREQTNRRQRALLAKSTISEEIAEQAQTERDVAAAEVAIARSDVDVAKAAIEDAAAQHAYEQVILDHHKLFSPYDALVVERHRELGTVVNPGEPVFTLIDPRSVWVLAYVDEARAGGLRVGQSADVRLRSLPREIFTGKVARIGIESDRVTEERRVYIACDRCPDSFHLGEQAEVFVTTAHLESALLVPETVVDDFDGASGIVWTLEEGRLKRRRVGLGHRTLDARIEVVDGVPSGAVVVTEKRADLQEGRPAKARDEERR